MCTLAPIIRICRNFAFEEPNPLFALLTPWFPFWSRDTFESWWSTHSWPRCASGNVSPLFLLPFVCGPGVCCWSRQTGRRNSGILLGFAKSWKRMPDIDPLSPIRAIVSRSSKYGKPLGSESSLPGPKKTSRNSAAVMGPRTDRQKERFFFYRKRLQFEFIGH